MTANKLDNSGTPSRDRHLRTIAGRDIYFDWEEFLWDPDDWDEEVALALAEEMGMAELNESCWKVIRFMRKHYFYHGRAPMNKDLKSGTGMSLLELEQLFPKGIRLGARRLAGLPNPKACL
ncbi:TusE/DsrC/DsvC family sulfur relay protein [Desulforhopalus singaporensis]|uniref:tRNA 2-thiouridine synthesizing protein E n=1 Tax=Desulforhopalus singaporensis TaxID=91360 RepID=A0A1H0RLC6_9BACT|nr:TusE/DsrC/DsvC family sulfur relay protein [Desulforhopalus singaporensis]SDP30304.1 tRNA 2-thiouridine synthesizing protein E [Desulforhopalus singaporensis]